MSSTLPAAADVGLVFQGRHTRVRPVFPSDYDWLYRVAMLTPAGSRWRLHGEMPNFEQFVQFLFQGSKATSLIEDLEGRPLGLVQMWNTEMLSGHSQITAFLSPEAEGKGWPLEGILMFVDYAFRAFNLRKIYVETLATELRSYRSLVGRLLRQEGHFPGHRYLFGDYVDMYMFGIYRSDFDEFYERTVKPRQRKVEEDGIEIVAS